MITRTLKVHYFIPLNAKILFQKITCVTWQRNNDLNSVEIIALARPQKKRKIKPEKLDVTRFSTECNIHIKGSWKVVYLVTLLLVSSQCVDQLGFIKRQNNCHWSWRVKGHPAGYSHMRLAKFPTNRLWIIAKETAGHWIWKRDVKTSIKMNRDILEVIFKISVNYTFQLTFSSH